MPLHPFDLHCHSTASDGALAPAAVVARAAERGVKLLALTDHDSTGGLAEARAAAQSLGVQLVDGVELSCLWRGMTVHLLGYGFDANAPLFAQCLQDLQQGRWQRAEEIDRRLAARGMPGTLQGARACQKAPADNAPARPHFADYLVQQGFTRDRREAFHKWLGAGKVCDVKQHWPPFDDAMAALHAAGAWISLAHPCHYPLTRSKRRRLISDFCAAGGHALEVACGMQGEQQLGTLAGLAREFGLLASAGSDFHASLDYCELGLYRTPAADLTPLWPYLAERLPAKPHMPLEVS
ncbi:phosphoesterase [Ventosimonas gracilis]|uniref:Phosphoesterase n=1 Tax=Ventosimonas gracilis TaxID=1680762 RepID=A0A139SYJ2_9GAMM|nr:PHP domain-containing protein [Ventosimonas gracilis]KXU39472.1 phosphoesterase [Ventosimonas gracilis]